MNTFIAPYLSYYMIETVSWGSLCQLLASSSSFSSGSRNIDWMTFKNLQLNLWLTNIKFFQFLTQFLGRRKNTDFIHNFCYNHKMSLLDYHQTLPLHPQLPHFWCSFNLIWNCFQITRVLSYLLPDLVEFLNSWRSPSFFSSSMVLAKIV